ncbi:MAG: hypothetical protein HN390_16430 [Anaerolineae bacterium]|mgnify:FL=1|jgi:hypothetical protein|nr:hypothetical protein [Anaerolineae bacterium]MBT7073971.1 hypothetical protein [Anaerolineae bacterium]MBT7988503.1 hypothetical protein [Anaerolineae bacterium]
MDRDILLLLLGSLIGFLSSILSTIVAHILKNREMMRIWERENQIRELEFRQKEIDRAREFAMEEEKLKYPRILRDPFGESGAPDITEIHAEENYYEEENEEVVEIDSDGKIHRQGV